MAGKRQLRNRIVVIVGDFLLDSERQKSTDGVCDPDWRDFAAQSRYFHLLRRSAALFLLVQSPFRRLVRRAEANLRGVDAIVPRIGNSMVVRRFVVFLPKQ